jgi:hypothetical protein
MKSSAQIPVDLVTKHNILLSCHGLTSLFTENQIKETAKWSVQTFAAQIVEQLDDYNCGDLKHYLQLPLSLIENLG